MEKIHHYDIHKKHEYIDTVSKHMIGNPVYHPASDSNDISDRDASMKSDTKIHPTDLFRNTSCNFDKFDPRVS